MQAYSDKLKDPRWQKMRLKILERDDWCCQICMDDKITLHVHHRYYLNDKEPWEYDSSALITLCENCHKVETKYLPKIMKALELGIKHYFLTNEIKELCKILYDMKMLSAPEVFLSALKRILLNPELQQKMIDDYFKELKK